MQKLKRTAASAMVGNALEMYDFALCGVFAQVIAAEFFPKEVPFAAFLAVLGIYASGFFMRPLGGLVFGYLGDIFGRRLVLSITTLLMAAPTLIIGILPSYETLGMLAPFIILLCRLLQGLCAGAEYSSASIFLIEHFNAKRLPAFAGSLVSAAGSLGPIMVLGSSYLVSQEIISWRAPFIFGALLAVISVYIRMHTDESPEFLSQKSKMVRWPILKIFKSYPREFLVTVAIGAFQGTLVFLLFVYMKIYMTTQTNLDVKDIAFFNLSALLTFCFLTPVLGYIAGKFGHVRTMRIGLISLLFYLYPCFSFIVIESYGEILFSQIFLAVLIGLSICAASAIMNAMFPVNLRCSGIAFGYNLGVALFGGTMPLLCEWHMSVYGNQLAPAFFALFTVIIGLAAIQLLVPKTIREARGPVFIPAT